MKKKNKNDQRIREIKNEINSMLLQALGYEVDSTGCIVDQESNTTLMYRNRYLKYVDGSSYIPMHSRDLIFDPSVNRGLSEQMFTEFMHKEEIDNGLYMHIYYSSIDPINQMNTYVEAIVENGNGALRKIIRSGSYFQVSLCYIDLILTMYCSDPGLLHYKTLLSELEVYMKDDLQ